MAAGDPFGEGAAANEEAGHLRPSRRLRGVAVTEVHAPPDAVGDVRDWPVDRGVLDQQRPTGRERAIDDLVRWQGALGDAQVAVDGLVR